MDPVFKTELPGWHARIEGERAGQGIHSDGSLGPAIIYSVGLLHEGDRFSLELTAFLADDLTGPARLDARYHRQTALRYVFAKLEGGWTPEQGSLPAVVIPNPAPGYRPPRTPRQPFMNRVLGRRTDG